MRGLYDSGATHPSYLVVENSDFEDSYAHLLQISWGIDHTTIINNYFKNFGSDPYSAGGPLANAIILSGTMDQSNWTISRNYDTLISGNEFYAQVNGKKSIILFQNNCQSLTVEENYFHGTPNVSVIDHTAPQTNYTIRNNIFAAYPVWLEGILRFWTDQGFTITSDAIHIYNNTFVGTPALEAIMYFYKGDSPADTSFTNLDIRNNIIDTDANDKDLIHISNNAAATGPVVQMSTFTCDYNRYNAGTNATPFWYRGTNYSLTNWKSTIQAAGATGADNHSAMGTVTFTSRATLDFTLSASDTVATGNGVDLSASFTTALISPKLFPTPNTGTRSAPWDIGAYKAGSGGDSPVNITGQGGTGGAATLTVTGYQVTTLAPTVTSTVVHFQ